MSITDAVGLALLLAPIWFPLLAVACILLPNRNTTTK
ncbi:hypothetical protein J2X12_002856 [Pseudarthrobacter oxydans]|uniref:Uncharacterized protein n=1 Tax=Pseudarthrobacter oxydans TaxID=1671 RepID=A0AAW8NB28_PSEOX|nr:hypothetical protein [Pseudarthrobacter oxydans]MDR7164818.1 hypothetical protein [Pseudarthrobacter oxydans]